MSGVELQSPFNWRGQKPAIDLSKENRVAKWTVGINKNPDAVKPNRTFTKKGEVLKNERMPQS